MNVSMLMSQFGERARLACRACPISMLLRIYKCWVVLGFWVSRWLALVRNVFIL